MAIPYPIEDLVDLATVHNVELIWYPQESAHAADMSPGMVCT